MGIDASTTTIGLCILTHIDNETKLIHYEFYKPNKKIEYFLMLKEVEIFIIDKIKKFTPDVVVIEDIIQYMAGGSGAKTIIPLAVINRIIGLTVYSTLLIPPILLNVLKIRHTLKLNKIFPKKEEMPSILEKRLNISFPWVKKINRKTKLEENIPENYDMADAICCALCYILLETTPKKIKKVRKK